MERYPSSSKLYKVYGRFVEEVQHNAPLANRCYAEHDKLGANEMSFSVLASGS